MLNYFINDDALVRGSDLRTIIDEINANEVYTDLDTITATKGNGGTFISVVDQYGGGGGGGGAVEPITHPWQMSITTVEDVKYCKVLGGAIATNITNAVPEGLVNLSTYGDGDTVYIYARIANDWEVGGSLNSYPTLTVKTGANDTNFAGNNVRFPASDLGYYFLPIGTIDVESIPDTSPIQLKYTINQIEKENTSIDGLIFNAFTLTKFLQAKTSDTATDTNYNLYVGSGQVNFPDGTQVTLQQDNTTVGVNAVQDVYVKLDSVKVGGGYGSFTSLFEFSNSPTATDTTAYFHIGRLNYGTITQSRDTNIDSPSRYWI